MGAKRDTYSNHLKALKDEGLKILRHYAAWKRMLQFGDLDNINRIQFADKLIAITCIENDLIIRLSKLTDTRTGVHSLERLKIEVPKNLDNSEEIIKGIDDCCELINIIKKKVRHQTLGHLKIGMEDDRYIPEYDLGKVIKVLIDLIDLLNNEKVNYIWQDGSQEKYNLRDFIE